MEINTLILLSSVVLLICIASSKLSNKFGIPTLLIFIFLGMLFGSDGIFKINFDNYSFTQQICSAALIFIMFYGGFGTNWNEAKPVAVKAILLSTLGVIITAILLGIFCFKMFNLSLNEGLLIGAVVASTDAASVFSILRSKDLNLKGGLASLLEIESGSNDPVAYMLTIIILTLMSNSSDISIPYLIFSQISFGLIFGVIIAIISVYILKNISFEMKGLHSIFVVAIALLSYALPSIFGGNGYLSVYITGIILGNSNILHKVELVHFFDGITWIMQILIFFILGLLSFPSQLPSILFNAIIIVLFLTFVSRPFAVFLILSWFKVPFKQQILISFAGLRGAASIVFAIYAMTSEVYIQMDLFHIVFCVSLFSVAFQGTLLPKIAKLLDLIDENTNSSLKTFTDYQDNTDIKLVELPISKESIWLDKAINQINLPSNILIVMIKRNGNIIVPKGNTIIKKDDVLVLNGLSPEKLQKLLL